MIWLCTAGHVLGNTHVHVYYLALQGEVEQDPNNLPRYHWANPKCNRRLQQMVNAVRFMAKVQPGNGLGLKGLGLRNSVFFSLLVAHKVSTCSRMWASGLSKGFAEQLSGLVKG